MTLTFGRCSTSSRIRESVVSREGRGHGLEGRGSETGGSVHARMRAKGLNYRLNRRTIRANAKGHGKLLDKVLRSSRKMVEDPIVGVRPLIWRRDQTR